MHAPNVFINVPNGTSTELWYRLARGGQWHTSGWNAQFFDEPVQFKVVLKSNEQRTKTPHITAIAFERR
jgi:hypothetical protein